MARHAHTVVCLENTARMHIGYELRQMGALAGARWTPGADLVNTAMFEATLVHARVLDEFLTGRLNDDRFYPEQLCARDYLDGWKCEASLDRELYDLICRRVVHIYCDRDDGPSWTDAANRLLIARDVLANVGAFVEKLRGVDAHRAAWFEAGLADAHRELEASAAGRYEFGRIVRSPNGIMVS